MVKIRNNREYRLKSGKRENNGKDQIMSEMNRNFHGFDWSIKNVHNSLRKLEIEMAKGKNKGDQRHDDGRRRKPTMKYNSKKEYNIRGYKEV